MRVMKKTRFLLIGWAAISIWLALAECIGDPEEKQDQGFTFIQMTCSLLPRGGAPERLAQTLAECQNLQPQPAFLVNTADVSETGMLCDLKFWMNGVANATMPVYTSLGNHDMYWSDLSKSDLAKLLNPLGPKDRAQGKTYCSFDYGGCHFVVLDLVAPKTGGLAIDPKQWQWLEHDLSRVSSETRVILFCCYAPRGYGTWSVSDKARLSRRTQRFPQVVLFTEHHHREEIHQEGKVTVVETPSFVYGGGRSGYRVVRVLPDRITVRMRTWREAEGFMEPEQVLPLWKGPRNVSLRLVEPAGGMLRDDELRIMARIDPADLGPLDYQIDRGPWRELPVDNGVGRTTVSVADLMPGRHRLTVRLRCAEGGDWQYASLATSRFIVSGQNARMTSQTSQAWQIWQIWQADLGSIIQGEPVVSGDKVFVGTWNRGLYALRLRDGKRLWRRQVKEGQIVASPAVDSKAVYFGAGHRFYACDRGTGKLLWSILTEGPVYAQALAAGDRVYVGAGHQMYALDARHGQIVWQHATPGVIQTSPLLMGNHLVFAACDYRIRALDAHTGKELWTVTISDPEKWWQAWSYPDPKSLPWPVLGAPHYSPGRTEPLAAGDRVIFAATPARDGSDNIFAFPVSTGGKIRSLRGTLCGSSQDGARLYLAEKDKFICISSQDGSTLWQCSQAGRVTWVREVGPVVLAAQAGRWIHGLEIGTMNLLWKYQLAEHHRCALVPVKKGLAIGSDMGEGVVFALSWE